MLENLSKKDALWQSMAFNICKDINESRDLVQDMYLKVYNKSIVESKLTNSYIYVMMLNAFRTNVNKRRKKRLTNIEDHKYLHNEDCTFEIDDESKRVISKFNTLTDKEKRVVKSSIHNSLSAISEDEGTYPVCIFRTIKKAREKILGSEYIKNKMVG